MKTGRPGLLFTLSDLVFPLQVAVICFSPQSQLVSLTPLTFLSLQSLFIFITFPVLPIISSHLFPIIFINLPLSFTPPNLSIFILAPFTAILIFLQAHLSSFIPLRFFTPIPIFLIHLLNVILLVTP